jgi:hypothetical protein
VGRRIRFANAITLRTPRTLVRSAASRAGLNVTRPALLITTSTSDATDRAWSSESPRFDSATSARTTRTFSRRKSVSAPP